jgi:hypothetical protein
MPKMVPIETPQSIFDDPSNGLQSSVRRLLGALKDDAVLAAHRTLDKNCILILLAHHRGHLHVTSHAGGVPCQTTATH